MLLVFVRVRACVSARFRLARPTYLVPKSTSSQMALATERERKQRRPTGAGGAATSGAESFVVFVAKSCRRGIETSIACTICLLAAFFRSPDLKLNRSRGRIRKWGPSGRQQWSLDPSRSLCPARPSRQGPGLRWMASSCELRADHGHEYLPTGRIFPLFSATCGQCASPRSKPREHTATSIKAPSLTNASGRTLNLVQNKLASVGELSFIVFTFCFRF